MKKKIGKPELCELTQAEINHLRRLLAWLRCENSALYLDEKQHSELVAEFQQNGHENLAVHHIEKTEKAFNRWPVYVYQAVRALDKTIKQIDGETVNAEFSEQKEIGSKA